MRSGLDDSAGKEVRIEDKERWRERDVAHVLREAVHWRHPVLVASYDTHSTIENIFPEEETICIMKEVANNLFVWPNKENMVLRQDIKWNASMPLSSSQAQVFFFL
ncbi:hypothetical protein PoB_007032800 [Plakobranchus ocellatus]|uniref:Uncharacterized protein n=1 Tax=Plakobranchus ocellatus TaxID=259542 RepID=A0AAV4DIF0_9GAST|nr:hypothetical protein PoB_007032800 [Plakobranchus ocellatus]